MFETIGRSFRLAKLCLRVLAADKELVVLPLLSSIGVVVLLLTFAGVGIGIGALDRIEAGSPGIGDILVAAVFYILSSFVIIFFNSALVHAAHERLSGGDPTVRSGLGGAWNRVLTIFVWAVIAGTVGLILNILSGEARERGGVLGIVSAIIISLIGAAWTLITYFVVPLIVIEHRSLGDAFKTSLSLLRRTWGEQVVGNFGLGIAAFVAFLAAGGGHSAAGGCVVATGGCRHRHSDRDWRRAHRRGCAGLRDAGRHIQGGTVQLCVERRRAESLPRRRDTGGVPPEVDRV